MPEALLQRVRETIGTCFGLDPALIGEHTTQADVEAWDSVGHLNLMLLIEDEFGVTLEVTDIELFRLERAKSSQLARERLARFGARGGMEARAG